MERGDHTTLACFFAAEGGIAEGATVTLGEEVAHHMRVRRLGLGERVAVVDGRGARGEGRIVRLAKSAASIDIDRVSAIFPPADVHMIVPVAERERMLWLAEKCTELGATSWRPVLWRRSRSVSPRGEGAGFAAKVHVRMTSALIQSTGGWLPTMHPDTTLERAVAAAPAGCRILLDPSGPPLLTIPLSDPVTIVTGPEGGIEEDERLRLVESGFRAASLAGNILRFETAALAALAITRAALVATTTESRDGH